MGLEAQIAPNPALLLLVSSQHCNQRKLLKDNSDQDTPLTALPLPWRERLKFSTTPKVSQGLALPKSAAWSPINFPLTPALCFFLLLVLLCGWFSVSSPPMLPPPPDQVSLPLGTLLLSLKLGWFLLVIIFATSWTSTRGICMVVLLHWFVQLFNSCRPPWLDWKLPHGKDCLLRLTIVFPAFSIVQGT